MDAQKKSALVERSSRSGFSRRLRAKSRTRSGTRGGFAHDRSLAGEFGRRQTGGVRDGGARANDRERNFESIRSRHESRLLTPARSSDRFRARRRKAQKNARIGE